MCITTSPQRIIVACEDIVNIYDAVTFVLRQSLHTPETVTKIQGSPDGSTLFFVHSSSMTMWDVQTGGLTHTFTTKSEIKDVAVSVTGDHIACGSSDGSVAFWNIHTKKEGKGFGNSQPVVTIHWISPLELAVATQRTVYIHNITTGETLNNFSIFGHVWGMVYLGDEGQFLVGTSQPGPREGQNSCFLRIITSKQGCASLIPLGEELLSPMLVGREIACITPPSGIRSFDTESCNLTNDPPLLDAATSMAVSLNRNLVAQTKDSIQIFSLNVLQSSEARNDTGTSHIYPLGEKHIVCLLQPSGCLSLLELETLQELHPNNNTTLGSPPTNQPPLAHASFSHGLVAEFGVSAIMQAWRSGAPLPEWTEAANMDPPLLGGLSPDCTRTVAFYGSPHRELRVKDTKDGTILAKRLLDDSETGEVYDLTFDSETRFHLKVDGPDHQHVQIPYDIIPSPAEPHSHTITNGEPISLSEPRERPPYALDENCEWVVDARSRKICWVSPGNVRRGDGGHFWVGLSLVMVGDDGVVRKLSFRNPDS
jgi:WD40 repeat protein